MSSCTLGDYVDLQRGNTYQSALLGKPGPVLLGLGSIAKNGGFRSDNLKTYGGASDPRILLKAGDIYVSLKDVTQSADLLGAIARVPRSIAEGRLTQDTVKLVFKDQGAPQLLIYWLLRTPQYREYCRAHSTGTTNLGLPRSDFLAFPIPEPSPARLELVDLLQAIDEKIDLNRAMNDALAATCQALFKDWFINFGPTRAKAENQAPYLEEAVWSLFPQMIDANGKPQGWTTSTIGDEVDVVGGSTPSTKESRYWGGKIAWATPKDLSSLTTPVLLSTERQITDLGLSQIGSGLLPTGTVLLSSRAPIGYLAISQIPVAVNQGFIAMVCQRRLSNVFVWQWAQASMNQFHQRANGSTFQEISKANFRPIPVTLGTPDIHDAFDSLVQPMFERIVSNEQEIRSLAATRDFLLPQLTFREMRVKDAAGMRVGEIT